MIDHQKTVPTFFNNSEMKLGITEVIIENLVHSFYDKIKKDQIIGHIFNEIIADNWDEHLLQMCNFWSAIALSTGRYKGQPLLKHINIPNLNEEHFIHWLSVFEENAYNSCSEEIANFFVSRARTIARNFMLSIKTYNERSVKNKN